MKWLIIDHNKGIWRKTWRNVIWVNLYPPHSIGIFTSPVSWWDFSPKLSSHFENVYLAVLQGSGKHSQEKKIIQRIHDICHVRSYLLCICLCTVLSHVLLQVIELFAEVVALLAGKRFLASVWKHVIFQTIVMTAREAALLTCKRLFSSMCGHVLFKVPSLCAGEFTLCAAERPLSRMCLQLILYVQLEVRVFRRRYFFRATQPRRLLANLRGSQPTLEALLQPLSLR